MWAKLRNISLTAAVAGLLLFGMGFAVSTPAAMPDYALVFLNDATETYLAPQCIGTWQRHSSEHPGHLRRSHFGEARTLEYGPDKTCAQTSAFTPPGPSISRLMLQHAGVIGAPAQWWDAPYRTEEGMVYPPNTHV